MGVAIGCCGYTFVYPHSVEYQDVLRERHPEERSDVGSSLDCHGQSPRNDAFI